MDHRLWYFVLVVLACSAPCAATGQEPTSTLGKPRLAAFESMVDIRLLPAHQLLSRPEQPVQYRISRIQLQVGEGSALLLGRRRNPADPRGAVGATAGAVLGTAAVFPLVALLASEASCHPRGAELGCYTPMIPLALGPALGASLGAATDGGRAAVVSTLIGSTLGSALGTAVILADSAPVSGGSILLSLVLPAAGAVLGNRRGQQ